MYNRVFSRHTPTYSTCAPSLSPVSSKRRSIDFANLKPYEDVTCVRKPLASVASKERRCVAVLSTSFRDKEDKDSNVLFLFALRTIASERSFSRRRTRSHPRLPLPVVILSPLGNMCLKIPLEETHRLSRFSRAGKGSIRDASDGPRTVRFPRPPPPLFSENGVETTTGTRATMMGTNARATACFWITRT